ncbi:glycosyltransferase family 4 protein [Paenibacillus chartarius]|uniref:Glycosyltransferase family 4 protein n=1 Tax=Paenibacillus chartarius TaxID=747481 RepID=A0ABV6DUZ9_9BACL
MPRKVLFVATVDYHFRAFHLPHMQWFQEQGWEVHVAARGNLELPYTDRKFDLPFHRSPFRLHNVKAYRELKSIMNEQQYDIVHCHTPVGGVLARLAARAARRKGTKVLYTAHGFHFCKGAPLPNWLVYYPIEKLLARFTDRLLTINAEDYRRAVDDRFGAVRIEHVHGVGVNTDRFKPLTPERKLEARAARGYAPDDVLMFYAAEFNKNKNQQLLLQALSQVKQELPHAKLLLAGVGPLQETAKTLAKQLGIAEQVEFLGYRTDIDELLPLCDIAVASSLREGLPVNIMEAMSCGLPVVATHNRGHDELVRDGVNGYLVAPGDHILMAGRLKELAMSAQQRKRMGDESLRRVERYSLNRVRAEMTEIYTRCLLGEPDDSRSQYHRAHL